MTLLTGQIRRVRAAVMFLTRLPTGSLDTTSQEISASTGWFSLVGLGLGLTGAIPFWVFPPTYAALVSMVLVTLLTGALHEDGWADVCDGVWGGDTPERRLEIMADSRVGAFGSIGLWFALSAKFWLLRDLAIAAPDRFPWLIAAIPALSRTAAVVILALRLKGRRNTKVSGFFSQVRFRDGFLCALIGIAGAAYLLGGYLGVCLGAMLISAAIPAWYFLRKLATLNGDCLGAIIVLTELAGLAALLATTGVSAR